MDSNYAFLFLSCESRGFCGHVVFTSNLESRTISENLKFYPVLLGTGSRRYAGNFENDSSSSRITIFLDYYSLVTRALVYNLIRETTRRLRFRTA